MKFITALVWLLAIINWVAYLLWLFTPDHRCTESLNKRAETCGVVAVLATAFLLARYVQ